MPARRGGAVADLHGYSRPATSARSTMASTPGSPRMQLPGIDERKAFVAEVPRRRRASIPTTRSCSTRSSSSWRRTRTCSSSCASKAADLQGYPLRTTFYMAFGGPHCARRSRRSSSSRRASSRFSMHSLASHALAGGLRGALPSRRRRHPHRFGGRGGGGRRGERGRRARGRCRGRLDDRRSLPRAARRRRRPSGAGSADPGRVAEHRDDLDRRLEHPVGPVRDSRRLAARAAPQAGTSRDPSVRARASESTR